MLNHRYVICNSVRLNNKPCWDCPHSLPHYRTKLFGTTHVCDTEIACHDNDEDPKSYRMVKCVPYNEKLDGAFDMHYDRLSRMLHDCKNFGDY